MKNAEIGSISLFEMLLRMDVSAIPIRLHPGAKDYLFQHYQSLRRIFSDVLGQAETDYLSIALFNIHNPRKRS